MRRRDQTDRDARRQRDSVGKAEERRSVRSRTWVRWDSRSVDLGSGGLVSFYTCRQERGTKRRNGREEQLFLTCRPQKPGKRGGKVRQRL